MPDHYPDPHLHERPPSIPPNVTWPMVWYKLIKDLPLTIPQVMGPIIGLVVILKIPGALLAGCLTAVIPTWMTYQFRSRPAEDR